MKKLYPAIVIVLLISVNITGQTLIPASPEEVGLSPSRLGRISTTIQKHIEKGDIAGAVTMIGRYGKVAHMESLGMMDIQNHKPMRKDAIFRIASMSKLITSVAAMVLYEEGHFFLTDPVSEHIPELKDMRVAIFDDEGEILKTVPAETPITVQHLLTHTAGFTYGGGYPGLDKLYANSNLDTDKQDLHSFVIELAKLPLAFQPGSKWEYSFCTDVLGYFVEVISGKKLNEFCKERIFDPLGMKDSGFYVPENKIDRLTTLYNYKDEKLIQSDYAGNTMFDELPPGCSGGGGLVSTIPDYAAITQTLLNGGKYNGVQLLGKKTVDLMMTNHLTGISNENWYKPYAGFGLGGAVMDDVGIHGELTSKGMFWWAGIFNTYFFVDPEEEMFGIIMFQISPFKHLDLMKRFKNLVYQSLIK
ncbi:serine hydrolase domain-containing protein [Bacteroidota bacterium]